MWRDGDGDSECDNLTVLSKKKWEMLSSFFLRFSIEENRIRSINLSPSRQPTYHQVGSLEYTHLTNNGQNSNLFGDDVKTYMTLIMVDGQTGRRSMTRGTRQSVCFAYIGSSHSERASNGEKWCTKQIWRWKERVCELTVKSPITAVLSRSVISRTK